MRSPLGRANGRRVLYLLKLLGMLARRVGLSALFARFIEYQVRGTGLFDADWYLRNNGDVAEAGIDPLRHYVQFGDREGRSPMRLFNPVHYRAHSQPRCPKIVNSLLHYAWLGRFYGASTSAWFDSGYYLAHNRDVKYSRMDPLQHFVQYGWGEGRQPTADFDRIQFLRAIPEFDPAAAAGVGSVTVPHATLPTDEEWLGLKPVVPAGPVVVDVIVPVYRGVEETLRCIYSVLSQPQQTPFELVVIYDAGPEPELASALSALAARGLFTYLENATNQGFVHTVNRGMRLHPARDVILLNADAQPFGDWVDRLRAAACRGDRVASVTPLSNNATICSYPQFNRDNPCVLEIDGAEVDALAARVNAGVSVPAPTGVGFCMYIRRAALDAVGLFDAQAFGLGYGEENDFCQRALQAGWQNLLAADTYVWHWGSTSFGGSRHQRVLSALEVLARRYPRYQRDVENFIATDPLRDSRRRLDEARLARARGSNGNVLIVTHARGGGTERHISELVAKLRAAGKGIFFLRPGGEDFAVVSAPGLAALPNIVPVDVARPGELASLFAALAITEVQVHQLVDFAAGMPGALIAAVEDCGVPLEVAVHDYLPICPRINLVDVSGIYCGEPGEGRCNQCLAQPPQAGGDIPDIVRWRARSRTFFEAATRVVVPDNDVSSRLQRYFPAARYAVRPHEDVPGSPAPAALQVDAGSALRIVVIGAIGNIKGYEVLAACSRDARLRNLPVTFTLLGYSRDDTALRHAGVHVTGRYREEELAGLLRGLDPHLVWLPSVWPETYCYTLTPALAAGLHVAAFDLGAIANRARAAGQTSLLMPIELAQKPERINDMFVQFRSGGLAVEAQPATASLTEAR